MTIRYCETRPLPLLLNPVLADPDMCSENRYQHGYYSHTLPLGNTHIYFVLYQSSYMWNTKRGLPTLYRLPKQLEKGSDRSAALLSLPLDTHNKRMVPDGWQGKKQETADEP